jgi:aspartate kinase
MKVFKFGGASVRDAVGFQNVATILHQQANEPLVLVLSAMGKTTNALEQIQSKCFADSNYSTELFELKNYHSDIARDLGLDAGECLSPLFQQLESSLNTRHSASDFDQFYDKIISFGELLSTRILCSYLIQRGFNLVELDARKIIITNDVHREASVNWEKTKLNIQQNVNHQKGQLFIIQGFIGSSVSGRTTTLGREGSDFTGAIMAHCLQAESLSIWKDVPGILNADPRLIPKAQKIDRLSYREAAEMTYYGATVIHPKTIKPLAAGNIPLWVRPFDSPNEAGSKISNEQDQHLPPVLIYKFNQVLLSISPKDFSFIDEKIISILFKALDKHHIRINLIQNSALSISLCFDFHAAKFENLLAELIPEFDYRFNEGLSLLTIKHYEEVLIENMKRGKDCLIEQKTRGTFQLLYK